MFYICQTNKKQKELHVYKMSIQIYFSFILTEAF